MMIDLAFAEHKADSYGALQQQVDMWAYESHCWVRQADSSWRCSWCGRQRVGAYVARRDATPFPLCPNNPLLEAMRGAGPIA